MLIELWVSSGTFNNVTVIIIIIIIIIYHVNNIYKYKVAAGVIESISIIVKFPTPEKNEDEKLLFFLKGRILLEHRFYLTGQKITCISLILSLFVR